jgi:hypothetical protein
MEALAQSPPCVGSYLIAPSEPDPKAASTAAAAATSPPNPYAPSATPAATSATSMTTSATSAASTAVTASPVSGKLYGGLGCSDIFFVEDIERRQADVRDFLFTESDFVRCRPNGCSRCAARQRQRQPGGSQQRHGACSTLPLCRSVPIAARRPTLVKKKPGRWMPRLLPQ